MSIAQEFIAKFSAIDLEKTSLTEGADLFGQYRVELNGVESFVFTEDKILPYLVITFPDESAVCIDHEGSLFEKVDASRIGEEGSIIVKGEQVPIR